MIDLTAIRQNLSSQNIQRMVPYYLFLYYFQFVDNKTTLF